jgi:hypothetical protein
MLAIAGALVFLVASFLPWFTYRISANFNVTFPGIANGSTGGSFPGFPTSNALLISGSVNGWDDWTGKIAGIAAILALLILLLRAAGVQLPLRPTLDRALLLILAGVSLLFTALYFTKVVSAVESNPQVTFFNTSSTISIAYGLAVAVLAALIFALGGLLIRQQG